MHYTLSRTHCEANGVNILVAMQDNAPVDKLESHAYCTAFEQPVKEVLMRRLWLYAVLCMHELAILGKVLNRCVCRE